MTEFSEKCHIYFTRTVMDYIAQMLGSNIPPVQSKGSRIISRLASHGEMLRHQTSSDTSSSRSKFRHEISRALSDMCTRTDIVHTLKMHRRYHRKDGGLCTSTEMVRDKWLRRHWTRYGGDFEGDIDRCLVRGSTSLYIQLCWICTWLSHIRIQPQHVTTRHRVIPHVHLTLIRSWSIANSPPAKPFKRRSDCSWKKPSTQRRVSR